MSGYLENYGAGEERRNRIVLWSVLGLLSVLVLSTLLYFQFRFYSEEKRVQSFLAAVRAKDFDKAYAIWGCNAQQPCRDYAMSKFMEDWGPSGTSAGLVGGDLKYVEPCGVGLIYTVETPGRQPLLLYTSKIDPTLGYSPWAICPEKGVSGITWRKIGLFVKRLFSGEQPQ
ncbi:MAG: hypothetical protein ABI693_04490 [Bryobacteraceae bacterium]